MYQLRFLSSYNLENFRNLVVDRVSGWLESWTLHSTSLIEVEARRTGIQQVGTGNHYSFIGSPSSSFTVSFSEVQWPELIWGVSRPAFVSREVEDAIISEVQSAFIKEVFDAFPSAAMRSKVASSFSDMMELRIRFSELGEIIVCTRQSFIAPIVKWSSVEVTAASLKSIYESIQDMRIVADVVLRFGEIPLTTFSSMAPGQVIESKLMLANNFNMRIADSGVFDVSLGKREKFVAVSVKGKSK